jgi:hypothetical protein
MSDVQSPKSRHSWNQAGPHLGLLNRSIRDIDTRPEWAQAIVMSRALRIEHPGAIHVVMNRGDRRGPVLQDDTDRKRFVSTWRDDCE